MSLIALPVFLPTEEFSNTEFLQAYIRDFWLKKFLIQLNQGICKDPLLCPQKAFDHLNTRLGIICEILLYVRMLFSNYIFKDAILLQKLK